MIYQTFDLGKRREMRSIYSGKIIRLLHTEEAEKGKGQLLNSTLRTHQIVLLLPLADKRNKKIDLSLLLSASSWHKR